MANSNNWQSSSDEEDWRNEDPNLLNVPELLYAAAAKLPPPKEDKDGTFLEAINMARVLIVNNNVVLQNLSQQDEFQGTAEQANQVLRNMWTVLEAESNKFNELVHKYDQISLWGEEEESKIFRDHSAKHITEWQTALNQLVESYKRIQEYIPQEQQGNDEQVTDAEKSELKNIPLLIKELEDVLNTFDSIKEQC